MNWTVILSVLGGSLAFFSAAAWLTRALVRHLLEKDVTRLKEALRSEYSLALEQAKAEFSKATGEHEVKFVHLHTKRAEILEELYNMLVETSDAIDGCADALSEPANKRRLDRTKEAARRGDALAEFIKRNKIYFSEQLAIEMQELYTCLIDAAICYQQHCEALLRNEAPKQYADMIAEVRVDMDAAVQDCETEFRLLLGVEPRAAAKE